MRFAKRVSSPALAVDFFYYWSLRMRLLTVRTQGVPEVDRGANVPNAAPGAA